MSKPNPNKLTTKFDLTVIVPAYNEADSIADTIESLKTQTVPAKKILVIDDCSTDDTARIAKKYGATVITPKQNTGSKAGAQNYGLKFVTTKYVMALDADTTLAPDAIELLKNSFTNKNIAASCGFVIPRFVETIWERGRYVEYLLAFTFYKPIQDYFEKPLISSGCFSMYQTKILKEAGGWPTRTRAEDMDLTWTFYDMGYNVRFIPEAVCYPIEPHDFNFLSKQLKRWSHGFIQNVRFHKETILRIPYLRFLVAVAFWDGVVGAIAYLFIVPLLTMYFHNPLFLLAYVIDAPMTIIPVLFKAYERHEVLKALASFPSFLVLRLVNSYFILEAFVTEIVLNKPLLVYEKGH
jgi:biofilm PGA synthesis N-glycosyltransferase PgaC